ncbi:MAG: DNA repair protein RadA [Treponema sp.]|jgi:DNA repair protein RadA/Sms|nr:DNA repair protein RadA [Treponema sp.]
MAKKKSVSIIYKCSNCNCTQPRWLGRCTECGEWNTFEEHIVGNTASALPYGRIPESSERITPVPLASVSPMECDRISAGNKEFDRVLGGGATKRSAILIGGEPGIGKSTLLLQTASSIQTRGKALYISGEETASQIRARADRLKINLENIDILCTLRLDDIVHALNSFNPVCVIIDSIQTVYSAEAGAVPGTVNQLKFCSNELISWVKERDSILFLSAHITKDGMIAGPKSLEHMVDTVISFERNSDDVRFLRAQKNRFGSIDELGIFSMSEKGLLAVEDPSAMFITQREGSLPSGIAIVPVFEGSRVFMVEIQALTVPAKASIARVFSEKIESARVSRIAAVLEKKSGLKLSEYDIYVNVAGGVRLTESAIDLALAAALYSARTDLPCPEATALAGEISLAGEIRPVNRLKQRIKTAQSLGFNSIFAPEKSDDTVFVNDIKSLIKELFAK